MVNMEHIGVYKLVLCS